MKIQPTAEQFGGRRERAISATFGESLRKISRPPFPPIVRCGAALTLDEFARCG
jgi:hypothetical protein